MYMNTAYLNHIRSLPWLDKGNGLLNVNQPKLLLRSETEIFPTNHSLFITLTSCVSCQTISFLNSTARAVVTGTLSTLFLQGLQERLMVLFPQDVLLLSVDNKQLSIRYEVLEKESLVLITAPHLFL